MEEEINENVEKVVVTETVETTSIPEQKTQVIETSVQQEQEVVAQIPVKEWHEIFSEFFIKIGMVETNRALLLELIVLSTSHEKQIPKHIEWLLKELTASNTNTNTKSVKRKIETENEEENPAKKVQMLMNPQEVQIRTTNFELEQRIDNFIQLKKSEINDSNRAEFLKKSTNPLDPNDEQSCARSDAAEINRNIQMKLDIVNNEDGPLARSTFNTTTNQHNRNDFNKKKSLAEPRGVEERLQNIEKHLKVETVTPVPINVYERLKILEDKIIQLERDYPPWSAKHFNQPNRQVPHPVTTVAQTSINNSPVSIVTPTFSATPTILTNSLVDSKRSSPSSISTNLLNSKNSRITPRPIKPKGRGRGQSSLTRSVMEQLQLIRNEKQNNDNNNNNNGTFAPLNETNSKSPTQILPQLAPQLPKVQIPRVSQVPIQPQPRPQVIQSNSSSINKLSTTPIPIAPKPPAPTPPTPPTPKIIVEETPQTSETLIARDRSVSPIIDPGGNNEPVPKEGNMVEMDVNSNANEVKNSQDISSEENLVVNENKNCSTNNTNIAVDSGYQITNDDVKNVNTTGLVSNIDENKGL